MDRMDVVVGVIVRAGRLLLTQRKPDGSHALRWESPGGKVENRETLRMALVRELREELGVEATVGDPIVSYEIDPPEVSKPSRVTFFRATIGEQIPRPFTAIGLGWFDAVELSALHMLPGNQRALGELRRILTEAGTST